MKTKLLNTAIFALFTVSNIFAQDVTTVKANSTDISDNLDLQAVASIFGESRDLEDFERRLNDPDTQISNLDLNGDNRVDYLRVIESTENNTHLIILQSVLDADTFQDVATIEVERDTNNNVSVQVVGDVYMYGQNYIYEPVYVSPPPIYNVFWVSSYRPYYSPWYWGYYPTYYNYWAPYPVYRYRNNVHNHINVHNTYVYVNNRRSTRAAAMYSGRRSNAYERQHPNTSFANRNNNVANRHDLVQTRSNAQTGGRNNTGTRANATPRSTGTRKSTGVKNANINTVRTTNGAGRAITSDRGKSSAVRSNTNTVRATNNSTVRSNTNTVRATNNTPARSESQSVRSNNTNVRSNSTPAVNNTPAVRQQSQAPVRQQQSTPAVRQSTPMQSAPAVKQSAPVQSAPAMRQSAPAMQQQNAPAMRQSAPAQSAPARSTGGGGGRRG